jgi:hypothetical protein
MLIKHPPSHYLKMRYPPAARCVIFGHNQAGGRFRHMGIVRQHHRDGLADIMQCIRPSP